MKITISPEDENEPKEVIYTKVFQFALTATALRGDIIPEPINHSHGDIFVLIGKLEELKERLRAYNGVNNTN